jgi:uncharacterized protein DUF5681
VGELDWRPKRVRRKPIPKSVVELIEALFAEKTKIKEGGVTRRITKFELIARQLLTKAQDGDLGAVRVYQKYNAFAVARDPKNKAR